MSIGKMLLFTERGKKMNIETYLIDCFSNNANIVKEDYNFKYADTCGYCELIGWKINFFRKFKDAQFLAAMSFSEIYSKYEMELSNCILEKTGLKIKFGSDKNKIIQLFGKEAYMERPYDDISRYVYLLNKKIFASFGFAKDKELNALEMIFDIDMAKDVFEYRKNPT